MMLNFEFWQKKNYLIQTLWSQVNFKPFWSNIQRFKFSRKTVTSLSGNFIIENCLLKTSLYIDFLFVNWFSKLLLHVTQIKCQILSQKYFAFLKLNTDIVQNSFSGARINTLEFELFSFYHRVMCPKDACGTAKCGLWSDSLLRISLIRIYTFFSSPFCLSTEHLYSSLSWNQWNK